MHAQLFGNYLLRENIITQEQFIATLTGEYSVVPRLCTLALYAGYMTSVEVNEVNEKVSETGEKFSVCAMAEGLLTEDQMQNLSALDVPKYLAFAQALIDQGIITYQQLETIIVEYQMDSEIIDLEFNPEKKDEVIQFTKDLFAIAGRKCTDEIILYIDLLFSKLSSYIGEDFTPLTPVNCPEYAGDFTVLQSVNGFFCIDSYIDMSKDAAIEFAKRYAGEEFTEFDDYVKASAEDFLNLVNGVFCVNMSNSFNVELMLDPPLSSTDAVIGGGTDTFLLPVLYPFGTINFLISMFSIDSSELPKFID